MLTVVLIVVFIYLEVSSRKTSKGAKTTYN